VASKPASSSQLETEHVVSSDADLPALYAPYPVNLYDQMLSQAKQIPGIQLVSFSETADPAPGTRQLFVRHDIDTAKCVQNLPRLLKIDREMGISAGIYFRVDDQEYLFSECRELIEDARQAGFHVGLHTTCYLNDDYMETFRGERAKFTREAGFAPASFNAHGLGEFRLDVRLKFYDEISRRLHEFGYEFSDCCTALRPYDYVAQDCYWDEEKQARYLRNDFFHPENFFRRGSRFLILAHPCYWYE
jgi:hypothetical protein